MFCGTWHLVFCLARAIFLKRNGTCGGLIDREQNFPRDAGFIEALQSPVADMSSGAFVKFCVVFGKLGALEGV